MKKKLMVLLIIFFLLNMIGCFQKTTYAFSFSRSLTQIGAIEGDETVITKTRSVAATIINLIQIVGTGISVIMLTYIAIRYMLASPTEKAEYKNTATGFIVGAVILFASTNIIAIISNFATSNIK